MRQYRSEIRRPVNLPAEVLWQIGAGYTRTFKATIQDVSASGMSLLVPSSIPAGERVQITSENKTRFATVRRCVALGRNHVLGVQFEGK